MLLERNWSALHAKCKGKNVVFFLLMVLLVFLAFAFTPPAQLSHGWGHRVFVSV